MTLSVAVLSYPRLSRPLTVGMLCLRSAGRGGYIAWRTQTKTRNNDPFSGCLSLRGQLYISLGGHKQKLATMTLSVAVCPYPRLSRPLTVGMPCLRSTGRGGYIYCRLTAGTIITD